MKRLVVFVLSVMLIAGIASLTQAGDKKNLPDGDPLATITPGECDRVQIAPFGTSLLASWAWSDGGEQVKFGGDAVYTINASVTDSPEIFEFEVEFGLVKFDAEIPVEDYAGQLVYRCSVAQTEPAGECNGSVLGLRDAIMAAAAEYLEVSEDQITYITADRDGVYVKAMNPGGGNGRQNYTLVNVCDTPIE